MMIKGILQRMSGVTAGLVLASVLLLSMTANAFAGDKVYLKDGRVLDGDIVREVNGSVWLNYTIGGVEQRGAFFAAGQIERIERDAPGDPVPSDPIKAERESPNKLAAKRPGEVRGVVVTLEGMVGIQFAAKPLKEMIPWLEEQQVDVVVLKVNSGGGLLLEIEKLHEVIVGEYKPRFRTVAWIESAISAAAMTSHVMEEVYFMPEGNYGACTGWYGNLQPVEGRGLEEVLYMMERASAEGKRDFRIMRSMQIEEPLSYNEDRDGEISWYNTEEGEVVVNPQDRILTFDAVQATDCKFSNGTADGVDELTPLLGYQEVNWLGRHVSGEIFPISKAEQDMRDWRKGVSTAEEKFQSYFIKYGMSVANAQAAQDITERGMFVGHARRHLSIIERACKNYPNLMLLQGLTREWFEQQHEMLRDLMKLP
jgi:hypothetical protein